jgi:four helix bundle protein
MQDFRKLRVWQLSHVLATSTLIALDSARGQAALRSQLARSIASVSANIAEGAAQASSAKYAHFLSIAIGSLTESHNHILLLEAVGALSHRVAYDLLQQIEQLRPSLIKLQQVVSHRDNPTPHRTAHANLAHDPKRTTQNKVPQDAQPNPQ